MKRLDGTSCALCNKQFIPAVNHMYYVKIRNKKHLLCSYSCYCKAKEEDKQKGK